MFSGWLIQLNLLSNNLRLCYITLSLLASLCSKSISKCSFKMNRTVPCMKREREKKKKKGNETECKTKSRSFNEEKLGQIDPRLFIYFYSCSLIYSTAPGIKLQSSSPSRANTRLSFGEGRGGGGER